MKNHLLFYFVCWTRYEIVMMQDISFLFVSIRQKYFILQKCKQLY